MNAKRDIAICGCGPAGLAAALLLHRSGNRVRIFERFATPHPVGSGLILQPTGLAVLAELGLAAGISSLIGDAARATSRVADVLLARLVAGMISAPLRNAAFQPLRMGANLQRH